MDTEDVTHSGSDGLATPMSPVAFSSRQRRRSRGGITVPPTADPDRELWVNCRMSRVDWRSAVVPRARSVVDVSGSRIGLDLIQAVLVRRHSPVAPKPLT